MHPSRPSASEVVSEWCELTARRRRTMLCIAGRTMRPSLYSSFETRPSGRSSGEVRKSAGVRKPRRALVDVGADRLGLIWTADQLLLFNGFGKQRRTRIN